LPCVAPPIYIISLKDKLSIPQDMAPHQLAAPQDTAPPEIRRRSRTPAKALEGRKSTASREKKVPESPQESRTPPTQAPSMWTSPPHTCARLLYSEQGYIQNRESYGEKEESDLMNRDEERFFIL